MQDKNFFFFVKIYLYSKLVYYIKNNVLCAYIIFLLYLIFFFTFIILVTL